MPKARSSVRNVHTPSIDPYLTAPSNFSADEGTTASAVVTSSRTFTFNVAIDFVIVPLGGATAGVDYTYPASPLMLLAGQTSATLSITIVTDGTDPGESFRIDWVGVRPL